MSDLILREFNGKSIRHRADGFMSLTDMCEANGKLFADWNRLKATKEYLKALIDKRYGDSHTGPIEINQGGTPTGQGTWGDRRVAMRLAQWLSPKFAIQVDEWVVELLESKADRSAFEASFFSSLCQGQKQEGFAYVYALHDPGNNRVKIGFTQDPIRRLKQLQLGDLSTLLEFYGVRQLGTRGEAQIHEKYLHDLYRDHLISGEWFNDGLMIDYRFQEYFVNGSAEFIFPDFDRSPVKVLAVAS